MQMPPGSASASSPCRDVDPGAVDVAARCDDVAERDADAQPDAGVLWVLFRALHRDHHSGNRGDEPVAFGAEMVTRRVDDHHAVAVDLTQRSPRPRHQTLPGTPEDTGLGVDGEVTVGGLGEREADRLAPR